MQDNIKTGRDNLRVFLGFVVLLFIAYLPVSSFAFFLKNDAFTGYFPPKFFMSESIRSGYLPLWNPYINYGFPQYGDMSGGYWSPVTWAIASTIGYNAYSFTIEALIYIVFGGAGMYILCRYFKINKQIAVIAGAAFMCSGFIVGSLQYFNWLSGAALLPWCLYAYQRLMKEGGTKNILRAILLFYLLFSSAHPGITIAAIYFFFFLFSAQCYSKFRSKTIRPFLSNRIPGIIILIVGLLLLSAGMIVAYSDIIPYFVRGEKVTLNESLLHPTTAASWLSVFLPFATVKAQSYLHTDISMRNCYFGIVPLLFFIQAVFSKKTNWQKALFIAGTGFALLSTGGIFKTIAYYAMPLIGFVRLNGEFRIFAIFCFIIIAMMQMNKHIVLKEKAFVSIIKLSKVLLYLFLAVFVFSLSAMLITGDSILFHLQFISKKNGMAAVFKATLDGLSLYDTVLLQSAVQIILLVLVRPALIAFNIKRIKRFVMIDLVIATLLNVPFTGAGKESLASVNQILKESPKGLPVPHLMPIKDLNFPPDRTGMIGHWSMYNKEIGVTQSVSYPILLSNADKYLDHLNKGDTTFSNYPFAYLKNGDFGSIISLDKFTGHSFTFSVNARTADTLIIQQNSYPHWFYDGHIKPLEVGINFMAIPVNTETKKVSLSFWPKKIIYSMIFSAAIFLLCLIWFFALKPKRSFLS